MISRTHTFADGCAHAHTTPQNSINHATPSHILTEITYPPLDAGLNPSTVSTTAVITVSPAGVSSVSKRNPSGSCSSFRFTWTVVISSDCDEKRIRKGTKGKGDEKVA